MDQQTQTDVTIEEVLVETTLSIENSELAAFGPTQDNVFSGSVGFSEESLFDEGEEGIEGAENSNMSAFTEELTDHKISSLIEGLLFISDKPVSLSKIKALFENTPVDEHKILEQLQFLTVEYNYPSRGIALDEVSGGWQLRTKIENQKFYQKAQKNKPFRLSGPALEVLSIVAYKQPIIKSEIDQIRGVESGHLLRALMEKGLVQFGDKSNLPGRPMYYESTKKFLEIFGLRNLKELPTLSQIDELLPEGIDEVEADRKQGLGQITESLAGQVGENYSEGEEELLSITESLGDISTSTEFFDNEKLRAKKEQEAQKAQDIREALMVGQEVLPKDLAWLSRYDLAQEVGQQST